MNNEAGELRRSGPRRSRTAWAVGLALALAAPLSAQQSPADDEEGNAELERVQVTGSRILRTDIEGPTPVLILDREDFENQGYLTVTDVLDSLTQNTGGTLSQQFVFGFTPAATGVNLRGFGTGRTLVLLDGRRLPVYPLGIGGTTQFFDLSSIPTAIIERIEILTDGASAIYGSDAIGGVVNIITRKDFDGLTTRVRYGDTADGGYQTDQYEVVGGATSGRTSAYLTLQHLSNTELLASQRSYTASDIADPLGRGTYSAFGSSIVEIDPATGGLIVTPAPGCGTPDGPLGGLGVPPGSAGESNFLGAEWCGFNRSQFRQLFPDNSRNTVSGRVDHSLDSGINLFAFARWTKSETNTQIEPFPYGGTWLFGGGSATPTVPNNGGLFIGPNGGPAAYARRLVEFGPRTSDIEVESYGATLGADGRIGAYEWEIGYTFNVQEVFRTRGGSIVLSALDSRVDNGLDLSEPIPQDVVDAVSFSPFTDAESQNDLIDAQISGFLPFDLPGGPVGVAAVAEFEQQEFFDRRDPLTLSGDASDGGSAGGGARDRFALGAEVSLPVLPTLELNVAARWDDYDDQSETGSAISPKLSLAWRPLDNVLLRGSWGQTFRAPDLQRLFGSTTTGFISVLDTPICQQLGGSIGDALPPSVVDGDQNPYGAGFDPCVETVQSVRSLTGANPSLEEEEGESINLGVVWNITDDVAVSADYYDMELEQIISTPPTQFILNQCAAGDQSFCALIERDEGGLLQGGVISAVARNLSLQEIRGVDLSASWTIDGGEIGRFDLQSETSWVDEVVTQFDDNSPKTQGVGIFSLPEWRSNFTANWNRGDFGATLRANFVGELGGINASAPLSGSEFVDSYLTFNGQLRYRLGQDTEIKFGVNNFTDERPPTDPTNPQWPWYINAGGYYSPFGREYYVEWVQHWR